jgi:hypothetical protein
MKYSLLLLVLLITFHSGYSQQATQHNFKGNWISVSSKDTIKLNVVNSSRIFVQIGSNTELKIYKYRIATQEANLILTIKSMDINKAQDSLIFTLTKVNDEEYKIKSLMIQHSDRPPESWLLENISYTLTKEKSNNNGTKP